MERPLKIGTRVRAKVRTIFGWKGTGTVIDADCSGVTLVKDEYPLNGFWGRVDLCRHEVSVLRDQTPPSAGRTIEMVVKRVRVVEGIRMTRRGVYFLEDQPLWVYTEDRRREEARKREDLAGMLTDEALAQFEACRRYIADAIDQKDFDGCRLSSLRLATLVGQWAGLSISNGMLCAAAVAEGFSMWNLEDGACWFYVDDINWPSLEKARKSAILHNG